MSYGTINANVMTDSSGGVLAPVSSVFRSRIINGGMVIDQRNAGASITPTNGQYLVDRWALGASQASKLTFQQNAGSVTPPVGFSNYMGFTSSSAYTVGASENFRVQQPIEGFNTSDLGWGTANAQTVTFSFWVRSSLTGTFGGALVNENANRSYPFTYTINTANTWEFETITIAGDTSGTWAGATNGIGIRVYFNLGAGATVSGTANAWQSGFFTAPTGATSVVGTSGATFYITGVQLEKGSTATSFDYRPYGTELALCQRYFEAVTLKDYSLVGQCYGSASGYVTLHFTVQKRTTPTATLPPAGTGANQITFVNSTMSFPSTIGSNSATEFSISKLNILATGYTGAFTAGNATMLYSSGSTVIQISAEL
jgi:hypothetical protein